MAEGITYLCPSCGAYLRYDGGQGKWVCDYCDSSYTKEELEQRGADTENTLPTAPRPPATAARQKPWILPVRKMWRKARIRNIFGHTAAPTAARKSSPMM